MKRYIIFLLFHLFFFNTFAQDFSLFKKQIYQNENGNALPYRILYPADYDKSKSYPLLLFLHGAGERGDDNEAQLVHGAKLFLDTANRKKYPAIIVFPQCPKKDYWARVDRSEDRKTWHYPFYDKPTQALGSVIQLLEKLFAEEAIDETRVYISGLSMGSMGTFELLARRPDLFAAAAPICGGGNLTLAERYAHNTDFWIFHGDVDTVVPVELSRKMNKRLQNLGANVKYSEYKGVNHNSWDNAFAEPNYLKWLFSKRKKSGDYRYEKSLFTDIQVNTHTYAIKTSEKLKLDIYTPKDDFLKNRPLLLYVHGGGFAGGKRDGKATQTFAKRMASMGYVVASMSYRLTMKDKSFSCDQPTPNKILTFQKSVEDIWDATNFLMEKSSEVGFNKNQIVLAGSSAGAEAILHAVYWKKKHLLEKSPNLPENFRYAGLVSMAGALVDVELINEATAIPSLFFHGTCDNLVPYASAPHHYCNYDEVGYLMLHGGASLAKRMEEFKVSYQLVTGCNGGHEWAGKPLGAYADVIAKFLKTTVVEGKFMQSLEVVMQERECDIEAKTDRSCR
ncbi:MAG: alpha/beta hydrolase fold domain-containing protein [Bacteroidota bacterium]